MAAISPPASARRSPRRAPPPSAMSPNPISAPPLIAIGMPSASRIEGRSFRKTIDPAATKIGCVDTNRTELATVVCPRDAIQKTKWKASATPLSIDQTRVRWENV